MNISDHKGNIYKIPTLTDISIYDDKLLIGLFVSTDALSFREKQYWLLTMDTLWQDSKDKLLTILSTERMKLLALTRWIYENSR